MTDTSTDTSRLDLPLTGLNLRATMNAAARGTLIPLTAVLIPLYVFLGSLRAWLLQSFRDTMVLADFAAAAITLVLLFVILRFDLRGRWVHLTLFLVALVATVDSLIQLSHSYNGWDTTNLALIIAATGIVSLSVVTSTVLYAVIWAGWCWCVLKYNSEQWLHFGLFLLWTTGISAAVQAARTKLLRRLIQSETQQRLHLEAIVAERTQQLGVSVGHLRHSERLASLGTFAAGIAHEINNPVGMIVLSAEQMRMHPAMSDERLTQHTRDIIANAQRCGRIVKNVLRFARHESLERLPDDVNSVVQTAVELVHSYVAQKGGEVQLALSRELPTVRLNRVELEQVFVNLIQNGVEAAESAGGRAPLITITTQKTLRAVRVTVVDNGVGIPPEDRAHIFDPFFTTRQGHGGTGLGLSLVYGIVSDHGGTIRVEGITGGGTEMTVELPAETQAQ